MKKTTYCTCLHVVQAYQDPPGYAGGAVGKVGLGEYKHRGFLVNEVSRTLDYGFADYSTGQAFIVLAEKLSKDTGDTHLRMELRKQAEGVVIAFQARLHCSLR